MSRKKALDQILEHYKIEEELAYRFCNAPKEDGRSLYYYVYNELYRRGAKSPQLIEKAKVRQLVAKFGQKIDYIISQLFLEHLSQGLFTASEAE